MTSSRGAVLLGEQEPTYCSYPRGLTSAGEDAIDLAARAGLFLDPWQALVINRSLCEEAVSGRWATPEVGLIVPRQNGKGSILEARELAGLILFGEQLIMHSAHEFKTATEAFLRIKALFENYDDLRKRVKAVRSSHGEEGIELKNGSRLRFIARSRGSGRGFSADLTVLDEAYALTEAQLNALMPTMSARPNPQFWLTSSAPLEDSMVLKRAMLRGRAGADVSQAYFEWARPLGVDLDDREQWRLSNPSLGYRLTLEAIERERATMSPAGFERERLGVVDLEVTKAPVLRVWDGLADVDSKIDGLPVFALDISPDRSRACLAVAGRRSDGTAHVEVIEAAEDAHWIVPRIKRLAAKYPEVIIALDSRAGGAALASTIDAIPEVTLIRMNTLDVTAACARFYDACSEAEMGLRHLDQFELNDAVAGAITRSVGDAWAWDRRKPSNDITPLVASTFAFWLVTEGHADFDIASQVF